MNKPLSRFSAYAILLITFALLAYLSTLFFVPYLNTSVYRNTLFAAAGLITGGLLLMKARRFIDHKSTAFWVITLSLLCLAVKLTWVLLYRIAPLIDYETFFVTAKNLAESGTVANGRYIALFPHIFGYSYFLHFFLSLFGSNPMVPPLVNVALTCISLLLIYYICNTLFTKSTAVVASLIWIFYPSQTMYNMFVLSEPLYTSIILGTWALLLYVEQRDFLVNSYAKMLVSAVILSVLLAVMNAVRPIAMILIVSLFIYLFIIAPYSRSNRKIFFNKILFFIVVVALYTAFSAVIHEKITANIGEEPSTLPGYSLYVGFNEKSSGIYNDSDADLLFRYSKRPHTTAQDAQEEMFKQFKLRIAGGDIDIPDLLLRKYEHFLKDDSLPIYYMRSIFSNQNDKDVLTVICNAFYQFTVFLSAVATLFLLRRKEKSFTLLFPLYFIGLTMAQMLVEVSGRYHYSGILVFTILSAYVLTIPAYKKKTK